MLKFHERNFDNAVSDEIDWEEDGAMGSFRLGGRLS